MNMDDQKELFQLIALGKNLYLQNFLESFSSFSLDGIID